MAPRSSAKYAFEWHHPLVLEIVENNNRVSMRQTSGDTSAPMEALGFLGIQSPEKNLCSQPELYRALASSKAYSNLNCSNAAETFSDSVTVAAASFLTWLSWALELHD
ncbi:predicted protein [Histoplasma capsulatum var. duboisii H88]|uniref:Predicted protein n=2 Tax=Ajellomyces capsulatus TaxID=5037 RepID=F0UBJ4_AJEC8|nr:predicted protein [Histoplasma capsulatum H143]EGC43895.1 predicted protein [Histoplasma capsulatum var. duboisii H88]